MWRNLQVSPLPHFETFHLMQIPFPLCLRTQLSFQSFKRSSFLTGGGVLVLFGSTLGSIFFGVTGAGWARGRGCRAVCMSCRQYAISDIVSLNDQLLSLIADVTAIQTDLSAAKTSCKFGDLNVESTGTASASSLNLWWNSLTTIKWTNCNIARAFARSVWKRNKTGSTGPPEGTLASGKSIKSCWFSIRWSSWWSERGFRFSWKSISAFRSAMSPRCPCPCTCINLVFETSKKHVTRCRLRCQQFTCKMLTKLGLQFLVFRQRSFGLTVAASVGSLDMPPPFDWHASKHWRMTRRRLAAPGDNRSTFSPKSRGISFSINSSNWPSLGTAKPSSASDRYPKWSRWATTGAGTVPQELLQSQRVIQSQLRHHDKYRNQRN